MVAPTTNKTYTANFNTQYFLTTSHGTGGTVTPAERVEKQPEQLFPFMPRPLTATVLPFGLAAGTGSYSGANNPASITMGGPITETAAFVHN